ncbi:MAG: hypothetical protein AB7F98_12315 [Novosphingobium sp.]
MSELDYQWPWRELPEGAEQTGLQQRCDYEITPAHALWGRQGAVVARSDAGDDVLVRLADGSHAIVHLTWGDAPGNADWPHALVLATIGEVNAAIAPEAEDKGA